VRTTAWTRGDLLLAGGAAVALAASAETAWSLRARFALDLEGLSALERAGVALWDFRPLGTAVFALAAIAVLLATTEPPGRLPGVADQTRAGVAVLAGAHAALAIVIAGFAIWIAALGEVGRRDELGFVYSPGDRAFTLVTQLLAWLPLGALLAGVAVLAARGERRPETRDDEPAPQTPKAPVSEEMEELWRERLAHGPSRERARTLLRRIHSLEAAGDADGARELAEQMRKLS
jgi:hypothetical protein